MGYCRFCGKDSGEYVLCYSCNSAFQEGLLDRCTCGNFKESEFSVCLECHNKLKLNSARKKSSISDSVIKGRLAEAIVEEMFLSMGYKVFRFGVENSVPGFGSRYLPKTGDVANEIRTMPDFIVVKDSNVAYLEVKYRTNGEFDFKEYYRKKGGYPYSNAHFILVTPQHIKIQRASELQRGMGFVFLNDYPEFDTNKEIILEYIRFCRKFFGNC